MLLGKRPRPPIRRTTSMTGISIDHHDQQPPNELVDAPPPPEPPSDLHHHQQQQQPPNYHQMGAREEGPLDYCCYGNDMVGAFGGGDDGGGGYDQYRFLASMVSPRNERRSSSLGSDFVETAHFLRTCGLCNRRLAPGKDIYMYRGDTAFCSLECREEQMKQDERKQKYNAMAAMSNQKEESHAHASSSAAAADAARSSSNTSGSSKSQNSGCAA